LISYSQGAAMHTAIPNLALTRRETELVCPPGQTGSRQPEGEDAGCIQPAGNICLVAAISTRYPDNPAGTARQIPAALQPPDTVSDFSYKTFSLL
jgi:hypothetical protein